MSISITISASVSLSISLSFPCLLLFLFTLSISLWFGYGMTANKEAGVFVGLWVPSIISTGIYFRVAARQR